MQLFPWFTASSSIKYGKVFNDYYCVIDCAMMEKFDSDSDYANGAFSYLDATQKSRLDRRTVRSGLVLPKKIR